MIVICELRSDAGKPCGAVLVEQCWTRGPAAGALLVPLPLEAFDSIQDASAFLEWAGRVTTLQLTRWRAAWVRVRYWARCASVGCTERVEQDGAACATCARDAARAQRDAAAEEIDPETGEIVPPLEKP